MKLADVPGSLILRFEEGYVPMDEPPGGEEHSYRAWKEAGGTVKPKPESAPAVWGILELMGHVRLAGRLSEEEKFGAKLGRIDVPLKDGSFVTQFFGASSVYRLTIVSEEVARSVARNITQPVPVSPWELPKQLAAPKSNTFDPDSPEGELERERAMRDDEDDDLSDSELDDVRMEP